MEPRVPAFATEKDLITIPALRRLLAGYGLPACRPGNRARRPGALGRVAAAHRVLDIRSAWLVEDDDMGRG